MKNHYCKLILICNPSSEQIYDYFLNKRKVKLETTDNKKLEGILIDYHPKNGKKATIENWKFLNYTDIDKYRETNNGKLVQVITHSKIYKIETS